MCLSKIGSGTHDQKREIVQARAVPQLLKQFISDDPDLPRHALRAVDNVWTMLAEDVDLLVEAVSELSKLIENGDNAKIQLVAGSAV